MFVLKLDGIKPHYLRLSSLEFMIIDAGKQNRPRLRKWLLWHVYNAVFELHDQKGSIGSVSVRSKHLQYLTSEMKNSCFQLRDNFRSFDLNS